MAAVSNVNAAIEAHVWTDMNAFAYGDIDGRVVVVHLEDVLDSFFSYKEVLVVGDGYRVF